MTATGGTVTTSGIYTIHTFTTSGTLTVTNSGTADILIVGGGGSDGGAVGSVCYNAGGGGGQVRILPSTNLAVGDITVTVGDTGQNSVFGSYSATKGMPGRVQGHGGESGSGNNGGSFGGSYAAGGGGGDSAPGTANSGDTPGQGGAGTYCDYSGTNTEYGKGGGGGNLGGTVPANLGRGRDGQSSGNASGIVIVRYLTIDPSTIYLKDRRRTRADFGGVSLG